MNAKKRLGKWLLYSLCMAPAVIMLGFYWLEYIPSQHEYFMNLRFRSLAMMGDHLRIKIERLATSFKYATESDRQDAQAQYIAALLPDLTFPARNCEPAKAGPRNVELGNMDGTVRFYAAKGCPAAEASFAKIFTGFTCDDMFEDVFVADSLGRVVYQRSASSPRIATLGDLLKTASGTKAAPGEGAGIDADAVRKVRLDDSDFTLLIQPVRIPALGEHQTLQICGLVRCGRLAEEARHVPPQFLLLITAPLLIVFLSGPFLKILLLTRTGRLAFHDMALLGLFTVVAAALATLALVSTRQYWLSERRTDHNLAKFAGKLNEQIVADLKRMRGVLERFDAGKTPPGDLADQQDLQAQDPSGKTAEGLFPFEFVFWANGDGCQFAKWTTTKFNTRRVDQTREENFQNIVAQRYFSFAPDKPFTLQTVVSQTTSRLIVVMAIPAHASEMRACGDAKPSRIASVGLVAELRSLSSPLVPPGTGFAVFKPDGQVLFHSRSERNLHENLFEEISAPAPWQEAVTLRAVRSGAAYYRGRKFQFHVKPFEGIAGIPWSIAVFEEIEPRQAMIGRVWGETLLLFAGMLCLLGLGSLVVVVVLRVRQGLSWRDQIDFFLARLWPGARKPVCGPLARELAVMSLVFLAVVVYGATDAYGSTTWLLYFSLLAPVAAMAFVAWRIWKPEMAPGNLSPGRGKQTAFYACLTLSVVLLAAAPVIGMWSVCEAYETHRELDSWQHQLMNSVTARRSEVTADIVSSQALSDQAKTHFLQKTQAASASDEQNYAAQFWQTKIDSTDGSGHGDPVRLSSASGSGQPVQIMSFLPSVRRESDDFPPLIGIAWDALWWMAAVILLGCGYAWNCKAFGTLFLSDFRYTCLPVLTSLPCDDELQNHLLVLGLPLARKDEAVRKWLGYQPARVNLYTAHFSRSWVERTTASLQRQLMGESMPAAQTAVVGGTAPSPPAIPAKSWVHVSNLETKLSEASDRQVTADLIEKLIMMDVGESRVRLIVTSVVDPVFHFDSVLNDERKKIYEHPLPEPELQRLARLLHNFRKVQAPGPDAGPPDWAATPAGAIIYEECRHQQALLNVGREVAASAPPNAERSVLLAMIAERAQALYKLYWSSCTRSEKLLLIQLAQTGFVNPLCLDTLEELIRKGLILPCRRPCIMNETFRQFLETVEGPDTVHQWESEAGESTWLVIRNIVVVLIVVGLAVVGLTQNQIMQSATAALTGVLTLMAGLSRLLGYLTGRRVAAPAVAAQE